MATATATASCSEQRPIQKRCHSSRRRPKRHCHDYDASTLLLVSGLFVMILVTVPPPVPLVHAFRLASPRQQCAQLSSSPGLPKTWHRWALAGAESVLVMVPRKTRRSPLCLYSSELGGNVRMASNKNNEDDFTMHKSDDASVLYSTVSPIHNIDSPSQIVRWDQLLEATKPLTCEDGDEECLFLQLDSYYTEHDHITAKDYFIMGTFLSAMTAAFVWLVTVSGPGGWKYFLAGGLCATASHVIPVPIDVVKTRKQVDPELASQSFPQAFSYIFRTEGVGGLLSGLGPTAIGYLMEGAIKYGVYEILKPVVFLWLAQVAACSKYLAFLSSKVVSFSISAAISGMAASVMLLPMEALRIRMVANPEKRSRGWLVTGYKMLKNEGATSMTKAMVPMLSKQIPYTVTKNVSFDFITKYSYTALVSRGNIIGPIAKFAVPLVAAAITSVLSCITSQPGDMVLSLMNAHQNDRRRTRDIVHDIFMSDRGVQGFFVGLKTRFLHVGIIVTLQLLIYDVVKRMCGIAATGMAH